MAKSVKRNIIIIAVALGALIWVIDAAIDLIFFYDGSFASIVSLGAPPAELYMRILIVLIVIGAGVVLARFAAERESHLERIDQDRLELEQVFHTVTNALCIIDTDRRIVQLNDRCVEMIQLPPEQILGKKCADLLPSPLCNSLECPLDRMLSGESTARCEFETTLADGSRKMYSLTASPFFDPSGNILGIVENFEDITLRKRLQDQFIQAQKMESIGRLAGGIAHDFNNLLTVIIGNADLLLMTIPPNDEQYRDIREIKNTAERAATLTRQLLAFSRHQIVAPRIINLNHALVEMDKMFRRLISENIELVTIPGHDLWPVKIDPGQVEQVLTNLVVNARDAMPQGGKLIIETANVVLSEAYTLEHQGTAPGDFVMMAVSDTGHGMDRETQAHIFEPFFTTKQHGEGTGLGLSTCYGIVKQNLGNIWVYSELGKGTTFKVYLPRAMGVPQNFNLEAKGYPMVPGSETVMVVEDEETLKKMIVRVLRENGYRIIDAANGEEALRVAEDFGYDRIDLLVSDVVMPMMSGKELASTLHEKSPELKVLFISGYTTNSIVHQGVLDAGTFFLQKPFTPASLLMKVRQVLDS